MNHFIVNNSNISVSDHSVSIQHVNTAKCLLHDIDWNQTSYNQEGIILPRIDPLKIATVNFISLMSSVSTILLLSTPEGTVLQ
jgi:hypothetical protein